MRRFVKIASVVVLLGELLALSVRGTFGAFSSETDNAGSTIAAGTLALSTTSATTTCDSYGGSVGSPSGNNNSNCGTITVTGGPFVPGQSSTTSFQVENAGSLAAGDLSMYAATNCTPTPGICDAVEFYVEETNASGSPIHCYYPTTNAGACSFAAFSAGGVGTLTDFTNNQFWSSSNRLILTGGLGAVATRYFALGFELPAFAGSGTGNSYQGASASFDLTWYLDQQGP